MTLTNRTSATAYNGLLQRMMRAKLHHGRRMNAKKERVADVEHERRILQMNDEYGDGDSALLACLSVSSQPHLYESNVRAMLSEPRRVYTAFGVHPLHADEWNASVGERIRELVTTHRNDGVVAIGECGLDYHDFGPDAAYTPPNRQKTAFVEQLQLGVSLNLPIVVHTREAEHDTLELLREHVPNRAHPLHVHCFTDSPQFCRSLLQHFERLYIGFSGVITFPNADSIRDALRCVPLNRLLVETDAPFMAPAPYRGATCHCAHIPTIVERMAAELDVPVDTLCEQLVDNAKALFELEI